MQANILDRGPDNRQATGFRRKDVDLIGALTHITKEAFNSIGSSNVSVHGLRKGIKGCHTKYCVVRPLTGERVA